MNIASSNKKIIGLTGGIGSGKSLISDIFTHLGIPSYNSDIEAKKLYNFPRIRTKIIQEFGKEVYSGDLLRKEKLAEIVFTNKNKLQLLNAIIHPEVKMHFENWVESQNSNFIIKETAILIETKIYKSCDYVISVTCPETIRIERILKREHISREQISDRIAQQLSDSERNKYADWILENSGNKSIIKQVYSIFNTLNNS
jgi:dephospho-CoA kinase